MNPLKHHSNQLTWLMGFLLAVFVAGCSGGGDGGTTAQPGTVGVSMTDAPACGFDEVNVTVRKVRVHQSSSASDTDAGWTDITLDPARKINLLDLNDPTQPNFALETLGESSLAAGHYTQLRLVLVPNSGGPPFANSVVLENTITEIPLVTPSAVQSGIKLIHQFDVGSGQRVDLLLDFDACKSIVKTGINKYKLKPVIKVIPFVLNGIEGFVDTNLLGSNVAVSAQQSGNIVRSTVPNTTTGKFFLTHLAPGVTYDVVITADGHATAVIAAVPVPSSTSITIVSTNLVPFPLQTSTSQSISGIVKLSTADDDVAVFVAAKQTLVSGPTVVKSQVSSVIPDDPMGEYGYFLTLPIAAPSLGQYSTTLPITLTAQSAVVGEYSVEASATGYTNKSVNLGISAGSVTHNYFLDAVM